MIIDGRTLAADRREEVRRTRAKLGTLSLGAIIGVQDPVTESYIRIKRRVAEALAISVTKFRLSRGASTEDAVALVRKASVHDGILIQLPLAPGIDVNRVRNAIPPERDADVLGDRALTRFNSGAFPPTPPVPAAMQYVLKRHNISCQGKKVAVVGYGRLVGRPAKTLFEHLGATVSVSEKGDDISAATRDADIVILGTGVAGILKPDMVKEGVAILDAGASELGGKMAGDADPACAEKAAVFTPVPGGVGPIAVVEVFANLVYLAKERQY